MSGPSRILFPLGLIAMVVSCGAGGGAGGSAEGPVQRVVLITCDTLRTDRLGLYGYPRDTSPNLDAFAREGVVFDTAYSAAPLTAPALCALLTGRLPDEVGMSTGNRVLMPPQVTTLAEVLGRAGIPTAAVVSNWVLREPAHPGVGIRQGFDHYDDDMPDVEPNRPDVHERVAAQTTDAAVRWVRERPDDRFFLWVHYQDPHGPYTPPEEDVAAMDRPLGDEPLLRVGTDQRGVGELPGYQVLGEERHPERYRIRYDAEIRYFDRELGRFLRALEEEGLVEEALIIFTADHGESLGEHDTWFSHGQTLHRELIDVPLVVRYPAGVKRPAAETVGDYRRVRAPVGHLDLFPTVVEALGLVPPPSHGQSLLRERLETERIIVQTVRAPRSPSRRVGISDGRYRVLIDRAGTRLFDLAQDPDELVDRSGRDPERVQRMLQSYRAMQERLPDLGARGLPMDLDEEALRRMEALGYAGENGG